MLNAMCTSRGPAFRSGEFGILTYDEVPLKRYPVDATPTWASSTVCSDPGWLPVASFIVVPLGSSMCHRSWVAGMTASGTTAPSAAFGAETAAQAATAVRAMARVARARAGWEE